MKTLGNINNRVVEVLMKLLNVIYECSKWSNLLLAQSHSIGILIGDWNMFKS